MDMNEKTLKPLEREFIRLLTDFGFKRVFGTERFKNLLLRFLNALFEGEMRITNVEFKNKEILPNHSGGKKILYDVYCTTDTNHHFVLEMQQEESENFSNRIMFYGANAIVQQGMRGVEYEMDPVYCIVFTDFYLTGLSHTLLKDFLLIDRHTDEIYSDRLRFIFLSLPEVPKEWDDCDTELLRILYLLKNMENMTRESKPYKTGEYDDFFEASAVNRLEEAEAVAYSESYFKELENQSAVRFAAARNREAGRAEGRAEGLEKGMSLEREKNIAAARKAGLSEDMIKSIFGL